MTSNNILTNSALTTILIHNYSLEKQRRDIGECKPETKAEWLQPAETWIMKWSSKDVKVLGFKTLLTTSPWPSWPQLPLPQDSTLPAAICMCVCVF